MSTLTSTASDIREEIRNANQNFEKNFANGDARGMASLYTNDGMLLPPGAAIQQGSEAIRNFWQMVMDLGVKTAQLKTLEVNQLGETAIEVGHYELGGADGQPLDNGKYIVIWQNEAGEWKLQKDIWNTSKSS
ncbi:MAG TPA: SgcJ/EcaC family oxidoreductase [Chryseolinea sp.]